MALPTELLEQMGLYSEGTLTLCQYVKRHSTIRYPALMPNIVNLNGLRSWYAFYPLVIVKRLRGYDPFKNGYFVLQEGLEPSRARQLLLKQPRLPFRHQSKCVNAITPISRYYFSKRSLATFT